MAAVPAAATMTACGSRTDARRVGLHPSRAARVSPWASLPQDLSGMVFSRLIADGGESVSLEHVAAARLVCASWSTGLAAMVTRLKPGSKSAPANWARHFPNLVSLDASCAKRYVIGEPPPFSWAIRVFGTSLRPCVTDAAISVPSNIPKHAEVARLAGLKELKARAGNMSSVGAQVIGSLTGLTSLDLSGCNLSDTTIIELYALTSLKHLDLQGAERVTDYTMLAVLKPFKSLQRLNLTGCVRGVSDELMQAISSRPLKSLCVRGCSRVSLVGVKHLLRVETLEHLDLGGVPGFNNDCAACIADSLPNLTSLNIQWATSLRDDGFASFSKLQSLTHLDASYCSQLSAAGVADLLRWDPAAPDSQPMPHLKSLKLNWCRNLGNEAARCLKVLKSLTSLELCSCDLITNRGLASLSTLTNLTNLDISSLFRVTNDGMPHLAGLQSLRTLNMTRCNRLTSSGLQCLTSLSSLENLDLRACGLLTDPAVIALKALPCLKVVDLRLCKQITRPALAQLGGRAVHLNAEK